MKQRLDVGLDVYIVLKDGILRGQIEKSMNRGQHSVKTFLGNIVVNESKLFKLLDFVEACKLYERLYGVK